MPTLYLTEDHAYVHRDTEDCLQVEIRERREGGVVVAPASKRRIPLHKVDEVVVMGDVTMTASALYMLLDKNIEVHFLDGIGRFKGRLTPGLSKNSLLRLAQHRAHNDLSKRCELARRFVIGKLSNQRTMLQRTNRRQSDPKFDEEIALIGSNIRQLAALSTNITAVPPKLVSGDTGIEGTPLETILGLEGSGSAAYFRCFGKMLADPEQWPFAGRIKRPPTDAVNALLSFGYSVLTTRVASAVQLVGFDQFVGFLHSSIYGRQALALDLMEEFRPLVVDSVVLTLLNNRMLTTGDFQVELGAYRLKKEPRRLFLTRLEERLNEEIMHPIFASRHTYRRCIEMQARLVAKFLTCEIDEYPPFITR